MREMNPEARANLPGSSFSCRITERTKMEIDIRVIKRYFERKEREEDKNQIIDWFSDIKFEKDIQKKYRLLWDELAEDKNMEVCSETVMLGRIYHKIKKDEFRKQPIKTGMVRILSVISKIAAVLFIPLLTYVCINRVINYPIAAETAYLEFHSPLGIRTQFCLPDGSTGWLNGGSNLQFPPEFSRKSREVFLKGEAYFDVVTDSKRPFVVKGEHINVIAHGTSFNVQAYQGDLEIRTTLITGEIRLEEKINDKVMILTDLKPNQMSVYYPDKRSGRIETVNAKEAIAWTKGKLAFRDETFTEVVKKINRWYNVELVIKDQALRSYSYQATFMDETLEEVLKLLNLSAPILAKDLGREKRPDGTYGKRKIELYYEPT